MNEFENFSRFCEKYRQTHWNCNKCQFFKYCSKINKNIASFEERYKNIKKLKGQESKKIS